MNIYPFVEISPLCEDYAKENGFEIESMDCRKLKNGLIQVFVNWKTKASIPIKYATRGGEMFGYEFVSMNLRFSDISFKYGEEEWATTDLNFDVGLQTDLEGEKISYEPMFFQNYGYAACCWFGKRGEWDNTDGAETLLPYTVDKN